MTPSGKEREGRLASRAVQVAFLIALVTLWYLATTRWRVSPLLLPNPVAVLRDFWEILRTGEFLGDLRVTLTELAAAFVPSKERFLETTGQGRAFLEVTRAAWSCPALPHFAAVWDGPVALPIAVGVACAGHGIACEAALHAFLHALAANWISAGVRLVPLGQTDGQRVLAALESIIAATAQRALATPLEEVGTCALRADIAGMRHETQYTRLFRS